MKKFNLLLALALTVGVSALSLTTANAQTPTTAAAPQEDPKVVFDRKWYESCQTKKDDQCIPLSKELLEKYPNSQYAKFAQQKLKNDQMGKVQENFQTALKNYYNPPQDAAKLDQLFRAGDEWLKTQPGQQFVIGQMALAAGSAVMSETYKDATRAKTYAEQALQAFEPTTPPEGWEKDQWNNLRELVQAQSNQFLGYQLVQTKGDVDQALGYLNKAIMVKGKDGAGWKDPNNYWLRAQLYSRQYADLQAKYGALTDDEKRGEQGQALLKQVNEVLDTKLIPEYARVVATATKPEAKDLRDAAKKQFDEFWKYRTGDPTKSAEYLRNFDADPTIEAPTVPAKAADTSNLNAPTAPTAGGDVKLRGSSGAPGMASGNGKATTTNGTKAAPAKKAPAKRKGRRN